MAEEDQKLEPLAVRYNPLSLPKFSGSIPVPRSEASFRVWCSNLAALKDEEQPSEKQIRQVIRRSLVGEAAECVASLSVGVSSERIEQCLKDNYSSVASTTGWAEFHTSKQQANESVTAWKIRLEKLYCNADPNNEAKSQKDKLMMDAFLNNLYSINLKVAVAHDRRNATKFDDFFSLVKSQESMFVTVKPHHSNQELKDEIRELREELARLKSTTETLNATRQGTRASAPSQRQ